MSKLSGSEFQSQIEMNGLIFNHAGCLFPHTMKPYQGINFPY